MTSPAPQPLVSAVIPTHGRPGLVVQAVESVLAQTHRNVECVVVIDGPDAATRDALAGFEQRGVRVIERAERGGGGVARNDGVAHARGEWVAFLDDDDTWEPAKLERQLSLARSSRAPAPVVSGRLILRRDGSANVEPARLIEPHERVDEYLYVPKSGLLRRGLMQTSTLLAPRDLLLRVPFDPTLPRHQDWDWLLRVAREPDVAFLMTPEPVAVWNADSGRPRVSGVSGWRYSYDWARARRGLFSPRAYAAFLLIDVAFQARDQRQFDAFVPLIDEAFRHGEPDIALVARSALTWLRPRMNGRIGTLVKQKLRRIVR